MPTAEKDDELLNKLIEDLVKSHATARHLLDKKDQTIKQWEYIAKWLIKNKNKEFIELMREECQDCQAADDEYYYNERD